MTEKPIEKSIKENEEVNYEALINEQVDVLSKIIIQDTNKVRSVGIQRYIDLVQIQYLEDQEMLLAELKGVYGDYFHVLHIQEVKDETKEGVLIGNSREAEEIDLFTRSISFNREVKESIFESALSQISLWDYRNVAKEVDSLEDQDAERYLFLLQEAIIPLLKEESGEYEGEWSDHQLNHVIMCSNSVQAYLKILAQREDLHHAGLARINNRLGMVSVIDEIVDTVQPSLEKELQRIHKALIEKVGDSELTLDHEAESPLFYNYAMYTYLRSSLLDCSRLAFIERVKVEQRGIQLLLDSVQVRTLSEAQKIEEYVKRYGRNLSFEDKRNVIQDDRNALARLQGDYERMVNELDIDSTDSHIKSLINKASLHYAIVQGASFSNDFMVKRTLGQHQEWLRRIKQEVYETVRLTGISALQVCKKLKKEESILDADLVAWLLMQSK